MLMLQRNNHTRSRTFPTKLFLEATTRCNLRCKICVKQNCDNGIASGDMSVATFNELLPIMNRLDEVIISGIGEPLLHGRIEHFICEMKKALPSSASVGLQTNGTLLTRRKIERLLSVDLNTICISVDAVTSDLLSSIRSGAHFVQLEKALALLNKAKARSFCSAPSVGVQFVLMQDNMRHLPQVLQWAGRLGVDFAIVSHMLPFDPQLSPKVVYPSVSDASLEHFRQWKKRISQSGLRIQDYPVASMKYYKKRTVEEKKLIAMVEAMKADGLRKDISLNLSRLMTPEDVWVSQVETIFEKAVGIARSAGMDLILPALKPMHARQCSFIEENSVFVDWQGSVSPCHFTWHKYVCYPDGRRKIVQPLSFGNVNAMSLDKIWNGGAFKSFRNNVMQYDYPYCCDCGLSPCDYIDSQVFEHDCHTTTVPCCDCPWPTGILNCLQ